VIAVAVNGHFAVSVTDTGPGIRGASGADFRQFHQVDGSNTKVRAAPVWASPSARAGLPRWTNSGRSLRIRCANSFGKFGSAWILGGPRLCALMNTNLGWLMYLRHDDGETGFSSRNSTFGESDAMLSGLVFDGLVGGEHVPVIAYRLSNGQGDEYPASWALPEPDVMRALEYFVEHEGRRPLFVQ
jgi:immunity protein Imm1 of predicted polymorphic toxin system